MNPPITESISENRGISFLSNQDKKIYSVGISTGGLAEIKMAQAQKERHITATTIDPEGAEYAAHRIQESGFAHQIAVKIEDVCQPLSYSDDHFDYIYARLVLHYLPQNALTSALKELYRVLRIGGRIFVVVRSTDCLEAYGKTAKFDPVTCLTTYFSGGKVYSRYFHTQESIQNYLSQAGFICKHIETYQERLCVDFQRTQPSSQMDSLIEILAAKEDFGD